MTSDPHQYPGDRIDLSTDVTPPSYGTILDWMKMAPGRPVSFDIWARGNYVRRLIHAAKKPEPPLVVEVATADQMRWAYRRLALLGLPVDFLYTGSLTDPQKVLHLYPTDVVVDCGWGYVGAPGSIAEIRGRRWMPIAGYSCLMPDTVTNWLVDEVPQAFRDGNVFVAPAPLVGVHPSAQEIGIETLAEVAGGTRVQSSMATANLLLQLELPYLDKIPSNKFDGLLKEHEEDLVRFRSALRRLVGKGDKDVNEVIDDIKDTVAELSRSAKHQGFRRDVSKLGGVLATFTAAVAATAAASTEMLLTIAGVAVATGATATLVDFWKQRAEHRAKLAENPFYFLWQLGAKKPSQVQRAPLNVSFRKFQRLEPVRERGLWDYHWLTPLTPGLKILVSHKGP